MAFFLSSLDMWESSQNACKKFSKQVSILELGMYLA